MTVFLWSTTAATNDDVDGSINWQEGQSPASVNNSARAMMAAIAKWRNDLSGNLVTAGTSTAYTLTTNQVFTSLTDGLMVAARMSATNGASPTLNVDSLGAKSIATLYGTAIGSGKLRSGAIYVFTYDSTDDKWIVQGNPNDGFESGTKMLFVQQAAPTGWTKATDQNDKALRIVSGSSGGTAGGSTDFTVVFTSRTIAEANLPSHSHTFSGTTSSNGAHTHTYEYGGSRSAESGSNITIVASTSLQTGTTSSNGAHTHTYSGTTSSVGSGTAMDFAVKYLDVIYATRD